MRSLLPAVLASLVLFRCQSSPEPKPTDASAPTMKPGTIVHPLALLSRSSCQGRCPSYVVRVFEDGRVEFEPVRDTLATEVVRTRLAPEQLAALQKRLAESAFATWKTTYENTTTADLPSVHIGYRGRVIFHRLGDPGAPPELVKLEDDLDVLIGTSQWVTGQGAPEK